MLLRAFTDKQKRDIEKPHQATPIQEKNKRKEKKKIKDGDVLHSQK